MHFSRFFRQIKICMENWKKIKKTSARCKVLSVFKKILNPSPCRGNPHKQPPPPWSDHPQSFDWISSQLRAAFLEVLYANILRVWKENSERYLESHVILVSITAYIINSPSAKIFPSSVSWSRSKYTRPLHSLLSPLGWGRHCAHYLHHHHHPHRNSIVTENKCCRIEARLVRKQPPVETNKQTNKKNKELIAKITSFTIDFGNQRRELCWILLKIRNSPKTVENEKS